MTRLLRAIGDAIYGIHSATVFGTVIVGVLGCSVIVLPGLERRRRVAGALIRGALLLCGMRLRVTGREELPDSPCMLVANHASYMDGLLLTATLPPNFSFVVKDDVASWPWVGRVLTRLGVVFIPRDEIRASARQTRALLRRLRAGDSLGIFPEGTFTRDPGLLPFKHGAFLLAARAGVPVVPAVIHGSRRLFGEGARRLRYSQLLVELLPAHVGETEAALLAARVRADMHAALSRSESA